MSDLLDRLKALVAGDKGDPTIAALRAKLGAGADDETLASLEQMLAGEGGAELRTTLDALVKETDTDTPPAPTAPPRPSLEGELKPDEARAYIAHMEQELGVARALQGVELPENMTAADAAKHVFVSQDGSEYLYNGPRAEATEDPPPTPPARTGPRTAPKAATAPGRPGKGSTSQPPPESKSDTLGDNTTSL